MKKQLGKSLTDIIKAHGESVDKYTPTILPLLIDALQGRTWDGKEAILEALSSLCVESSDYFISNPDEKAKAEDILIREGKKNNAAYKRYALLYMGEGLNAIKSQRYDLLHDYLVELVEDKDEDDDMDVDDDKIKPMKLAILANTFKSIGLCFPSQKVFQSPFANQVLELFTLHLKSAVWNVRVTIMESMELVITKLNLKEDESLVSDQVIQSLFQGLLTEIADHKVAFTHLVCLCTRKRYPSP